ncbi:PREDICTED: coiled-coil domain-containing protein 191 [Nanorana parkeri]|uniref:coiled-coil domain-containing protein 191 n=1 Tax=Nanorana parkeri TaxID=125878 RepID=UPI0008543302|nr:PREDICTED: coiled-coil domain-containing protein 191 [Nanorana parkeri]
MLPGAGDMRAGAGGARPGLYRWKRQRTGGSKPAFDSDNVEHWIKRVEQASEFAVSEAFSNKKPARGAQRAPRPTLDLESPDQLHDHDDAYTEAQELLSEWLSNKLRLELASEEDEEPDNTAAEPPKLPPPEFIKYNKFEDLYQYLEHETEDTNTQDFLQKLLQKEVVDSGILKNLRSEEGEKRKAKQRDPRVTMEVRHQQVKENRAQRQKALEKQKQERAMKKAALAQAQLLVQEESKQKALKTKKEEEEIQREMVKLRKEMNERRRVMEEARKLEWKRQQKGSKRMEETVHIQQGVQELESERRTRERQAKIQELLSQVYADNHMCLQKYFSAWYQLILERRVKMGKARAMADWKLQLRTFRAWRQHVWSQKLERETQKTESELRDQNRKQKVAVESYHKRLLRHCLIEWQLWCRAEKEKRELEARKEETKRKMAALLEAASSTRGNKMNGEGDTEVTAQSPETTEQKGEENGSAISSCQTPGPHMTSPGPKAPKHAWQVTRQHAALTSDELNQQRMKPSITPRTPAPQKKGAPYGENYENRHQFQQLMIEEQRRQLQEQKEMIQELMENQRLMIVRGEAKNASAVNAQLFGRVTAAKVTRRKESGPLNEESSAAKQEAPRRLSFSSLQSEGPNGTLGQGTMPAPRRASVCSTPHPAVRAMEERAAQREERRRLLEEVKRRREEEKLAQLRAAEEQRIQMEAAEREAELQRKREERRQQKLKEEEKQGRLQREKELQEVAVSHYKRALLRFHGLAPWKKLMAQSRQNMERAESHHRTALLRGSLRPWSHTARAIAAQKSQWAERLWTTILLRRGFRSWIKYKDYLSVQEERAQRRYTTNLQRKTLIAWLNLTQEEKFTMWEKQRSAAEHSQRRTLRSAFRTWRRFPGRMKELRLKEERLESLRMRVAEILPDFHTGGDAAR